MIRELHTNRLYIRRIQEDDWRDMREIWTDQSASVYAQYDTPNDNREEAVRERIRRWASYGESEEHMFFAVVKEERVIGFVSLHVEGKGYEMGYCFHSAFHRQGYAKESIGALCEALKDAGVNYVMAGTGLANTPSVALLSSLGFRKLAEEQVSFYKDEDGKPIWFTGGFFVKVLNADS